MKTVLTAVNATYNHTNLAIRYMEKYFAAQGCSDKQGNMVTREFTINDRRHKVLAELAAEDADIYGFSCYIWNISFVLELSAELKKIRPGAKIVFGGPEVSYEDESFLHRHSHIDLLIKGCGIKAISHLACGGAFPGEGKIIEGAFLPIDDRPFPYDDSDFESTKKQFYYETATGCPYSCSYCLSGSNLPEHNKLFFRSEEKVLEELKFFIDRGAEIIKLVDRTFNANLARACRIWQYLIDLYEEEAFKTVFHFEISADLLSDKALELLSRAPAGIFRFECGIQSTNPQVLKNVGRFSKLDKLLENIYKISSFGNIELHVDLIAGLPGEDMASFKKSFNDAYALKAHMLQLGFLKVLKGSRLEAQAEEFGLVFSDTPPYEILSSKDLGFEDLEELKKITRMVELFANTGFFTDTLAFVAAYAYEEDFFDLFSEISGVYASRGGFDRNFSMRDNVLSFLNFLEAGPLSTKENYLKIAKDMMKLELYRRDARVYFPELDMNMSSEHIGLSEELAQDFKKKAKALGVAKYRVESFSFDLNADPEEAGENPVKTFVLYDLSGPGAKILSTAIG